MGESVALAAPEVCVPDYFLSTGEAAKLCKISQQTIIRSFDANVLSGRRKPDSRFRQIHIIDLFVYMKNSSIPTQWLGLPEDVLAELDRRYASATAEGQTVFSLPKESRTLDQLAIDAERQAFSTGQAAKICECSQQKIIRLFDAGKIKGFRIPPKHVFRRIPRQALREYMESIGLPTDILDDDMSLHDDTDDESLAVEA